MRGLRHKKVLLLMVPGFVLLLASFVLRRSLSYRVETIASRTSEKLDAKLARAAAEARKLLARRSPDKNWLRLYTEQRIALYLFRNDSLLAWNNSQLPFGGDRSVFTGQRGFVQLSSGHYLYVSVKDGLWSVLSLVRVRPKYELQNRYLQEAFPEWLGIPEGLSYSPVPAREGNVTVGGTHAFSLTGSQDRYATEEVDDLCFWLFFIGLVLVLASTLLWLHYRAGWRVMVMSVMALVALRAAMISFQLPSFFYNSALFDVRTFGNADSQVDAYLGDILLNAMCFLFIALSFHFVCGRVSQKLRTVFCLAAALLFTVCALQLNLVLTSLVRNSTLSFNFLDFLDLSFASVAGLSAAAMYCYSFFVLLRLLAVHTPLPARLRVSGLLILAAVAGALLFLFTDASRPFYFLWPLVSSLPVIIAARRQASLTMFGLYLLIMSVFLAGMLDHQISLNRDQDLQVLSARLSERQDAVLEHEYERLPSAIGRDASIANLLQILPSTSEAVADLLKEKYFNGYFRRYNLSFALFNLRCEPVLNRTDPLLMNEGYFSDQILQFADSTAVEGLFFVNDLRRDAHYIGRVVIGDHRLYVLMQPKQFEELGSFPDLLLDESQQKHEKLKGISYAVYRGGLNVSNYGRLNYPPFMADSSGYARRTDGYRHSFFSPDPNTTIVLSTPVRSWRDFFTVNSYMLLLVSVPGLVLYFLYLSLFTSKVAVASLTRRIQGIIIVLLLVAMTAVGVTSGTLVREQFATENSDELREKTQVIYTDLLGAYQPSQVFEPGNRDAINLRLNEYARLFNTDISLFDSRGFLHATSQPRLYALGLAAPLAHPLALASLQAGSAGAELITERAGRLKYLSLYSAMFNRGGRKPAGYINLPYFARQGELVSELSGIINALVNVYVILFIVSIGAGLVLAGYITRPLRLIQQQISSISLGRKNEMIRWEGRDELGRLIAEYNQMLVKLEQSAARLARSERESAWREMARQVAHEIKNPLTPMKLNLQYLQHLQQADPEAFREKFSKASAVIIEQIDALATIATEFSTFAQLPEGQMQEINVIEVIASAMQLFDNPGGVTVRNRIPEEVILVEGDREQCLRVFNNLFTNAVQALAETSEPWIEIGRQMKDDVVVIQVRDNGSGIDDDLKEKIFTPNFTTKTAGSGLGLAMVRNIMEGFGGRVWFESHKGVGTIFYLEFRRTQVQSKSTHIR